MFIDPEAEAVPEPEIAQVMSATELANVVIERVQGTEPGGLDDYCGALFEQLHLEQLSHAALAVVCRELAVQVHLLVTGLLYSVAQRYGDAAALAVGEFQMTGSSWVMSSRLSEWLGCKDTGIDGIIAVLDVHPAFQPSEYWSVELTRLSDERARIAILECPASAETLPYSWFALLARGMSGGLDGLVKGVDPRARILACEDRDLAWDIVIDEVSEVLEEPLAVQVAKGTVLYQTQLEDRIPLLQV